LGFLVSGPFGAFVMASLASIIAGAVDWVWSSKNEFLDDMLCERNDARYETWLNLPEAF